MNELYAALLVPNGGSLTYSYSVDGRYIYVTIHEAGPACARDDSHVRCRIPARNPVSVHRRPNVAYLNHSPRNLAGAKRRLQAIALSESGVEWKEIYRDADCGKPFLLYSAYLVPDNDFAIVSCNKLTLIDLNGKELFKQDFPKNMPVDPAFGTSSDGTRFAISLGNGEAWKIHFSTWDGMTFRGGWLYMTRNFRRRFPVLI